MAIGQPASEVERLGAKLNFQAKSFPNQNQAAPETALAAAFANALRCREVRP